MRILMLNANVAGRGTYHRALWFGSMLAARGGHDVTLCTVSPSSQWRRSERRTHGIRIVDGPAWGIRHMPGYGSNWLDLFWRWRELRFGGYDAVYAFEYHPNVSWPVALGLRPSQVLLSDWCDWYAGAANRFRGVRLLHCWDERRETAIRRKAHRVSVISTVLRDRAVNLGIDPARVTLLREGVDTGHMRPWERAEARRALGIDDRYMLIGTLQDGAAFPALVDVLGHCAARNNAARLLLVGTLAPAQRAMLASRGLAHLAIVTGRCSDEQLPLFLSAADVFVLPMADTLANRARFPHKIGDYLAVGRPVVLTAVGDYPALLRDAQAAVVVADAHAAADAAACLLADEEQRRHLAARGRAWVREHLDWRVLAPGIVSFVDAACSARRTE
ncbi:glycosyltransferase family 4 protein [bacterium]|nr:glycosyltransferase family 4 protein [bacterium]